MFHQYVLPYLVPIMQVLHDMYILMQIQTHDLIPVTPTEDELLSTYCHEVASSLLALPMQVVTIILVV